MERGEAKIFVHEKCDGAFHAGKRHAAERAELGLHHVVLDALHQRRRHGAKPVRLIFGRQTSRETEAVAKHDRAGLDSGDFVDVCDHALGIQFFIGIERDLQRRSRRPIERLSPARRGGLPAAAPRRLPVRDAHASAGVAATAALATRRHRFRHRRVPATLKRFASSSAFAENGVAKFCSCFLFFLVVAHAQGSRRADSSGLRAAAG